MEGGDFASRDGFEMITDELFRLEFGGQFWNACPDIRGCEGGGFRGICEFSHILTARKNCPINQGPYGWLRCSFPIPEIR
ncbi:hypothetical protein M9H77_13877 [Catharanthus roseus]|uniref:Uncharacterized protein n=1 Tax=Catharanthus roseus TaxID=4058 RepID=A0ACC0BLP2_CATRO|nr:hypothetical protein M9H77_13877 [Catharanthus roseus]